MQAQTIYDPTRTPRILLKLHITQYFCMPCPWFVSFFRTCYYLRLYTYWNFIVIPFCVCSVRRQNFVCVIHYYLTSFQNKVWLREGDGTPLQYSCLENPMDRGAWWAAVHQVTKSRTRLSDFPFTFHFHALEKEMATHFSVLAWRIPGMGEPGGLPSMGSQSRTQLKWLSSSSIVHTW